jgi:hypothetical protein
MLPNWRQGIEAMMQPLLALMMVVMSVLLLLMNGWRLLDLKQLVLLVTAVALPPEVMLIQRQQVVL